GSSSSWARSDDISREQDSSSCPWRLGRRISWSEVIGALTKKELQVVAVPLPLTSLSDDAAALRRTLARTKGPVIVAGHAYAGAVIATANDERVRGLVYIAALAPTKERQSHRSSTARSPTPWLPSLPLIRTDGSGCPTKASPTLLRITQRQPRLPWLRRY